MKSRSTAIILLPVMLAACHGAAPSANQTVGKMMTAAQFQQKITALPGPSRDGVFMRAITDAGYDCQKINKTLPHAPIHGDPAWVLLCQQNTPFVAVINDGGYIQVVPGKVAPPPTAA